MFIQEIENVEVNKVCSHHLHALALCGPEFPLYYKKWTFKIDYQTDYTTSL